ncbi:BnaC03g44370D [Brassica napus]|uniref:BnaC03g44370D protein n=1 Tax=Brassica napus TaxID=3708 RepID=A0A078FPR8_BRANA|nr:BnaC03g44370D [Brassica napus]
MDSTKTKKEQLPWELIEEVLSHVPPRSLVRFRTVCKRWNTLFNDKTFINNHTWTFRFILTTKSKIYSVSINPKIVVRELTLDIPGIQPEIKHLVDCNEFLLCCMDKGASVWNPWLNLSRWIKADVSEPSSRFRIDGIGYDTDNHNNNNNNMIAWWGIHDFASEEWKDLEVEPSQGDKEPFLLTKSGVSLNGNLFSDLLCYLPCGMNHPRDALVLRVFRGDRFSLLKQCHVTKKIEIWVTKNMISVEDGNDVVWMNFMTLSIPNFPGLVPNKYSYSQPSYFIQHKRLVMCSCDETGKPWIYVVEENKLISKVHMSSVVDPWPLHCTYFPSLVPVPGGRRKEAELHV